MPVLKAKFLFLLVSAGEADARIRQDLSVGRLDTESHLEQHAVPESFTLGRAEGHRPARRTGRVDEGDRDQSTVPERPPRHTDLTAPVEHEAARLARLEGRGLGGQRDAPPAPSALAPLGQIAGRPDRDTEFGCRGEQGQSQGRGKPGVRLGNGIVPVGGVLPLFLRARRFGHLGGECELAVQIGVLGIQGPHEVLPVRRGGQGLVPALGRPHELGTDECDEFFSGSHGPSAPHATPWRPNVPARKIVSGICRTAPAEPGNRSHPATGDQPCVPPDRSDCQCRVPKSPHDGGRTGHPGEQGA